MSQVSMKQLLEAGVHFGHQTSRWNPKMRPFIFGARNGIHIIDLQQTVTMFRDACDYVRDVAGRDGTFLFVGTKKQAQSAIETEAARCGQFYVNNRWLGGTLTNFQTIRQSIDRMKKLEEILDDPASQVTYKKKERLLMQREVDKLQYNLQGIRDMKRPPDVIFIIDPAREDIAVSEANRLNIPVVAVVDSNCDPDRIAYCVPGNDDAIRAILLFCRAIADSVLEGRALLEERRQTETKLDGPGDASVLAGVPSAFAEAAPAAAEGGEAAPADVAPAEAAAGETAPAEAAPAVEAAPAAPVAEAAPAVPAEAEKTEGAQ